MIITRTPLRVSFFGGGTDIPAYYKKYGGEVLSTTIDKYLYLTCRYMPPFWEYKHRFVYGSNTEFINSITEIQHPSIRETMRYLKIDFGVDLHYNTDIPARSGMGSSSSFTVGLLNALYGLQGKMISKQQMNETAIHIEQDLIGEAVGSQDQTAAAYGGFNHIVFCTDGSIEVHPIVLKRQRIQDLNSHLLLVFTGFQRYANDIEKSKIDNYDVHNRELEMMKKYTKQAIDILNTDCNINEFGALLNDTWKVKKSLSDKVSGKEIDDLYQLGMNNGAIGGKLLGAGGGGFMLFFVEPEKRKKLINTVASYISIPFNFENSGSQVVYYKYEEKY